MTTRRALLLAPLAATLLAALSACSKGDELDDMRGLVLGESDLGRDFALQGTDGKGHRLADFRGKAVMVFFGFTQCPDVCPTALQRAVEVKQALGPAGDRLQVLFVTVDPERDTPEVLRAYTGAFDPAFLGLYGSDQEIRDTARAFKVFYQKVPTGDSYTMDHSSFNYLYDPNGRLRVIMKHTQSVADYVNDIQKLLAVPPAQAA